MPCRLLKMKMITNHIEKFSPFIYYGWLTRAMVHVWGGLLSLHRVGLWVLNLRHLTSPIPHVLNVTFKHTVSLKV